MSRAGYELFIFDFDGTLGDTKECVVDSFQSALSKNGLPNTEREAIIHTMGLSLEKAFSQLAGISQEEDAVNQLVEDYRLFYRELLPTRTSVFPGVANTLAALKSGNALCAVATSKKTEAAKASCEYLEIDQYIDLLVGDNDVEHKKPHPEMVERILGVFAVDKADAVMVGDSTYDIEMGHAAGIDTIGVTWGAHSEDSLRAAEPTHIIYRFPELLQFAT